MAKDNFGFGTEKISWDDPWGDNITIPHKKGKPLSGKEAEKLNIYKGDGFQDLLYKVHTLQNIDFSEYNEEDISKLISWYTDAREKAILKSKAYSDNQNVVSAQNEKLNEIQHVMKQYGEYLKR